jgi:hypothetical protein
MLTEAEIRSLSQENESRGWAGVEDFPDFWRKKICEIRAQSLKPHSAPIVAAPVADPEIDAVRERLRLVSIY